MLLALIVLSSSLAFAEVPARKCTSVDGAVQISTDSSGVENLFVKTQTSVLTIATANLKFNDLGQKYVGSKSIAGEELYCAIYQVAYKITPKAGPVTAQNTLNVQLLCESCRKTFSY